MRPLSLAISAFIALCACAALEPATAPAAAKHAVAQASAVSVRAHQRTSAKRGGKLGRRPVGRGRGAISERVPLSAPKSTPAATRAPSEVLFQSNFENSFEGWHLQAPSGRAELVGGSSFSGEGNARFEVREGDVEPETGSNRSEVSGPTFQEGQDLYVRDAIRVPSAYAYEGPWQLIQQLHETNWSGSPGIAVFLDEGRNISLGAGDSSPIYWKGPQLESDRWYDLVYHVYLSQDPSQGFVEVWLDGRPQTLTNGETKAYGQTIQTSSTYLKAGIYRSPASTGTSVVEHDQIVVGTSLAAVTGV